MARVGRIILFQRVEVVVLTLEVVVLVVAERLAVRSGLMCATVSCHFD